MALTEKELKRIADIQDRINNGVKIQEKTQNELNALLKKQQESLVSEKADLVKKNELAKTEIQSIWQSF